MLLQTMTPDEISKEVNQDNDEVGFRSSERLAEQFRKDIKRAKIPNSKFFYKSYAIKSARKNPWVFIFVRDPLNKISFSSKRFTYYYTQNGLRILEPGSSRQMTLNVYNAHLFQRYNERLKLNLPSIFDTAAHFFAHNADGAVVANKNKEGDYIEICFDGLILGAFENNSKWSVGKTFINSDLEHEKQVQLGEKVAEILKNYIAMNNIPVDATKLMTRDQRMLITAKKILLKYGEK